jgi:hypothetical protein
MNCIEEKIKEDVDADGEIKEELDTDYNFPVSGIEEDQVSS